MSVRKHDFVTEEFYHLYNRGVEKRNIFLDVKDYERFMSLLYLGNSDIPIRMSDRSHLSYEEIMCLEKGKTIVEIGVYCLMPNHFHLLIRECQKGGITQFMQKISTAYTMYFNIKNERSGGLFQGKFKSKHINNDEYLKYLLAYIHLNPIKLLEPKWKENGIQKIDRAENFLKSYRYSSFSEYLGKKRLESKIIDNTNFPEYFKEKGSFKRTINDWLSISRQGLKALP